MCIYCNMGDSFWRHDRPWRFDKDAWPEQVPHPLPSVPHTPPWPIEKLKEYLELLKQVKALEEQVGCPCEPNKADYIRLFETRIAALEKRRKAAKSKRGSRPRV